MKEKSAQRLLVFVPPRSSMAGRSQLASSTVVDYVATGGSTARGQTPIALLPKASSVDVVFDASDVFITTIDPPKLAEGKLRMALPNILEERLLADPADCHFALGRYAVAATRAPAKLRRCRSRSSIADCSPGRSMR